MPAPRLHEVILKGQIDLAVCRGHQSCLLCRHFIRTKDDEGRHICLCKIKPRVYKRLNKMRRDYYLACESRAELCDYWEGLL